MLDLMESSYDISIEDYKKVSEEIAIRYMVRKYGEEVLERYKWVPYKQDYEYVTYNDPINQYVGQVFVKGLNG